MASPPRRRRRARAVSRRRLLVLAVLVAIAALYVDPVQKYLRVNEQVRGQSADLRRLERRHARLLARRDALRTSTGVEAAARLCGWVLPGEHALVVTGLPPAAGAQCG
jgi:cell division protein FtsB